MLAPGTRIEGYELVCPIGEGGMAEVWAARRRGKHGFERLVALEVIHPRFARERALRAMLLDEARVGAAIRHPNVAQLIDLGEAGERLYIVMEYVDGESVADILGAMPSRDGRRAAAPLEVALRIVRDVCAGLHAAHELADAAGAPRGVIHRDVSPRNILLSVHGQVKLIDFGIALARERLARDPRDGSVEGRLSYMPPEQALGRPLDRTADVFAAGAVLYALLTGAPPFAAEDDAGTARRLLSREPAPLPPNLPPLVGSILSRALAFAPEDRFPTAGAMAAALDAALIAGGPTPDLEGWVCQNLSPRARERRERIAAWAAGPGAVGGSAPAPAPMPIEAPPSPDAERRHASAGPGAPEFFDVRALARRASSPERNAEGPPPPDAGSEADAADALELAVDPRRPAPPPPRGFPWKSVAGALGALLLLVAATLLALPGIVRDRIVTAARAAGVELAIGRVSLGWSTVTLHGVRARAPDVPALDVRCDRIRVHGLDAAEVRVEDVELTLAGAAPDVGDEVERLGTRLRAALVSGTPGKAAKAHHVSVARARVAWTAPFGAGTRLVASDLGVELDTQPVDKRGRPSPNVQAHGSAPRVSVATASGASLGPWALSFEQAAAMSRLRLSFDPPVPDGPSALYVWGPGTAPELTVRIPRSPLANLGVSPDTLDALGLPADAATELEAKLEARRSPSGRVEGRGGLSLFGARLRGLRGPVDVHVQGGASGPPGKPLDLERTTVTVGPFAATVSGTIEPRGTGLRVDTSWRVAPIPCERLARSEARSMGPFTAALQEIAHVTGVARITGKAEATGTASFDTAALDQASIRVVTRETCGLSIFGW